MYGRPGSQLDEQTRAKTLASQSDLLATECQSPSSATTLLNDQRLSGCGNASVRQAAMQSMQRTHGNRAVQRYVERQGALPVQCQDADDEYSPLIPYPFMGPLTLGWDYALHSVGRSDKPSREIDPVYVNMWRMMSKGQELVEANDNANREARNAITGQPPQDFVDNENAGASILPQYYDVSPAVHQGELDESEAGGEWEPDAAPLPPIGRSKRTGPVAIWDALLEQLGKSPHQSPKPGEEGYPYKWDSEGNVEYIRREKPKCVEDHIGEGRHPERWCPDPWDWDQMVPVDPEQKEPETIFAPPPGRGAFGL